MLFKGFQDSKNWECHGKILGLIFLSILFQNEEGLLKNDIFALFEDSNASAKNIWHRNWHLKTTKMKTFLLLEKAFKIWNVRKKLEAKLSFWVSSFKLLWKSVVLLRLHLCELKRVECALYNRSCCSKSSKNQRTSMQR